MLRKLQKYEKKIMFGLVIITALAFGITSQMLSLFNSSDKDNLAGEIMDRKVTKEEFQIYRNQCTIWTQCWLAHANDNYKILAFIPPFDMVDSELYNKEREKYLDEFTWVVLMMDTLADKAGVRVGPNEIVDYIKNNLFIFSTREEGFSKERYQWVLSNWRISEVSFEEVTAEFIKLKKYRDLIMAGIIPTTKDVYDEFLAQNGEIKIAWLPFDGNDYKEKIKVTDEAELKQYFQEHSADYKLPEKVQIEYVMADIDKIKDGLPPPNDEALQNYYNQNREKEFPSKSFIEARDEIKNRKLDEAAKEQSLEMVARAEERITLLELQGKAIDLKDIAQKFNLYYQVSGFLELDNMGELDKAVGESSLLRKQISTFQENELSRSISTDKGHLIFRLLKKQESYIPESTDQVKAKVTADFISYKSSQAAKAAADKLVQNISEKVTEELKDKKDDEKLKYELRKKWFDTLTKAEAAGGNVFRTAFFQKADDLKLLKTVSGDFNDSLFKKQSGEYDVLEDGSIYYVVQILEKRVPAAGSFDVEKDKIQTSISSKKKNDFTKNWLEDIKKQVNWKSYLDKKTKTSQ